MKYLAKLLGSYLKKGIGIKIPVAERIPNSTWLYEELLQEPDVVGVLLEIDGREKTMLNFKKDNGKSDLEVSENGHIVGSAKVKTEDENTMLQMIKDSTGKEFPYKTHCPKTFASREMNIYRQK